MSSFVPSIRRIGVCAFVVLFAFWGIWFLHSLEIAIRDQELIHGYTGPQWLLSYSHGFVRRGLPGEVLRAISTPDERSVEIAGWSITFAALVSAVFIIWSVIRRTVPAQRRLFATSLVVIFPLTFGSVLRNADYYDEIGIALLGLAVLVLARREIAPRLALILSSLLMTVAVACEEFLFLFFLPFVVVAALRTSDGEASLRRLARPLGLALAPALAVEVLCAVRRPSAAYIDALQAATGHQASQLTAVSALKLSISGQFSYSYDFSGGAQYTALTILIWLVVYFVGVNMLAALQSQVSRWYWPAAVYCAAAAVAMNVIFVDARRWWTLAFITQLALTSIAPAPDPVALTSARSLTRLNIAIPAALFVSIVALEFPLTTIHPVDVIGHGYRSMLLEHWIPGPNGRYASWLRAVY